MIIGFKFNNIFPYNLLTIVIVYFYEPIPMVGISVRIYACLIPTDFFFIKRAN